MVQLNLCQQVDYKDRIYRGQTPKKSNILHNFWIFPSVVHGSYRFIVENRTSLFGIAIQVWGTWELWQAGQLESQIACYNLWLDRYLFLSGEFSLF